MTKHKLQYKAVFFIGYIHDGLLYTHPATQIIIKAQETTSTAKKAIVIYQFYTLIHVNGLYYIFS